MIDKRLLDILACPQCKDTIKFADDSIICERCKLRFPVRDGIPIMLLDEAKKL